MKNIINLFNMNLFTYDEYKLIFIQLNNTINIF